MENDKLFELMTKMYGELQEVKSEVKDVKSEVKDVKSEVKDLKSEVKDVKSDVKSLNSQVTIIEQDHGNKLDVLLDGYKQNAEKLDRVEREVSKQEEVILRRIR